MKLRIAFVMILLVPFWVSGQKYVLVWSDEFNTPGLPDSTKWSYEKGKIRNEELQYYTEKRRENARIEDSVLVLEVRKEKYAGADYTSASIVSKGIGDWKYGKFEIRAKVPPGRGTWPALWMMPTNSIYGGWPQSGEIDIMEYIGVEPQNLFYTCHFEGTDGSGHQSSGSKSASIINPFNQFIKFTLVWTPDKMEWYANDKKFHQYLKTKDDVRLWPFNEKFYLILNFAYGGSWGGYAGVDDTKLPNKFLIDYVRVYQQQENEGPFSISVQPHKHGKVQITPALDLYPENTDVTVTAIPDPGFRFKAWQYQSAANPLFLTVNKNTTLAPIFYNPEELIYNGEFDVSTGNWLFYNYNTQNIAFTPSVVDSTFVFHIIKTTGTDWHAGFQQQNLTMEKTAYKLKFDAWAEQAKQLLITVSRNYPDWGSYLSKNVNLSTVRKSYEVTLDMPIADNNVRLYFGTGKFSGKLYFDNISLTKINSGPPTGSPILFKQMDLVSVFPNPASETMTIRSNGLSPGQQAPFEIYSVDGKLTYKGQLSAVETEISTGHFHPGIYILQVRRDQCVVAKKIIIEAKY